MYISDGTFDAYNDGCLVGADTSVGNRLQLSGPDGILAIHDLEIIDASGAPGTAGVILRSPNDTRHRIVVNNAGVLSTVPV
jgi:hypothetical protein